MDSSWPPGAATPGRAYSKVPFPPVLSFLPPLGRWTLDSRSHWSHPAPIMPVIMEPPPECPWTHFTLEGRSRTELFVDATEAEFLLELLGGPGPCCHLCVLSSYNSLWQLICLSNLISKYNSNCHVRHLMHPLHTHMRVHVFQMLMSRQRSDGVGLVQGEGLYFN